MIIKCHVILIKNFTESSDKNFDESFISFYFDLAIKNHCDSTNQNFHSTAEL